MTLIFCVILVALVFEYINGFHDTANSIATVVATKVLSPRQAVVLASTFNLAGALAGTAVASTIGKGLVDITYVTSATILCGLLGAIIWNLITWYYGLPSSSSHALIGGIVGSTLAAAHGDWAVVKLLETKPVAAVLDPVTGAVLQPAGVQYGGLFYKVVIPMFASPVCGLLLGFGLMAILYVALRHWRPLWVNRVFGKAQLVSSAFMGFSHGLNDAQKTMGIIALSLLAATKSGVFDDLPDLLAFLRTHEPAPGKPMEIALWVKITCAITMAAGTWAGGWRIIKTLGHKMVRLQPVHGFAAETSAAVIIQVASHWGMPLSTTHVISSAIMGVGAAKRFTAVKWFIVERMVWAWVLTIPVTMLLGYLFVRAARIVNWIP
jgi:PiT family inorganic phosphate transporter